MPFYVVIVHVLQSDCGLHKFFVSFNMILCIIISIASVLPKIQEGWFYVVFIRCISVNIIVNKAAVTEQSFYCGITIM